MLENQEILVTQVTFQAGQVETSFEIPIEKIPRKTEIDNYSFFKWKLAKEIRLARIRAIPGYWRTLSDLSYQLRPLDLPSEAHLPVLDANIRLL